jgi:hypothetical protein
MKLLDKIQRDIDEIVEFGYCNIAETFKTLNESRDKIKELMAIQKKKQKKALIDMMDEKSGIYGHIPYGAFSKGFRESIDKIEAALHMKPKAKGDTPVHEKASYEDPIVAAVVAKYQERSAIGIAKYGTTLADNNLSLVKWLTHLQEELMDATLYIEKLKANEKD